MKIELDKIYRVSPENINFVGKAKPCIEIFSAANDVTIRATTNEEFTGTYSDVPEVTDQAQEGEVYVTDCGESIKFMSFSCSDADAEIYVSGFKLIATPVHKVDTFSVSNSGLNYQVGDVLKLEDGATVPATFKVITFSQEDGTLKTVSVKSAGLSTSSYAGDVPVVYGDGTEGEVTLTDSHPVRRYMVNTVSVATAGSGYTVGDIVKHASAVVGDTDAEFEVLTVDASGGILTVNTLEEGFFSSSVAGTFAVSGGTGTGADLTFTEKFKDYHSVGSATIKEAGSGYGSEDFDIELDDGAELSFETGPVGTMTVEMLEDGEFDTALTSQPIEAVGGSGEDAEITVTTKPIY